MSKDTLIFVMALAVIMGFLWALGSLSLKTHWVIKIVIVLITGMLALSVTHDILDKQNHLHGKYLVGIKNGNLILNYSLPGGVEKAYWANGEIVLEVDDDETWRLLQEIENDESKVEYVGDMVLWDHVKIHGTRFHLVSYKKE